MIYKKEYNIKGKIISKKDIINLIISITNKYPKENELNIEIKAKFTDGTTIIDKELKAATIENDITIFDNIYFERLALENIYISIGHNYNNETIINLFSNKNINNIDVKSCDKGIYDSICHTIEESVKMMENQNKLYLLPTIIWGHLIFTVLYIICEILLITIIEFVTKLKVPVLIDYLMILILPNIFAGYTINYIEKKYPINQFYISETSINKPSKEKGCLYKVIVFIICNFILPIITSLITK